MVGLGAEDDDGEAAMGRAGSAYDPAHAKPVPKKRAKRKPAVKKTVTTVEEVLEDGKGNSKVMTVEQEEQEDALELPQQEEVPDDAATILKATPQAKEYLDSLNIDPANMPQSVQDRIIEKGIAGFGEMVAQWVIMQREKEESQ